MPPEFRYEDTPPYGEVEQLSPLVRRVVARNPSKFTYHGSGTFIIGPAPDANPNGNVAIIDPGPAEDRDRHDLEPRHPPRRRVPLGLDPHQRQSLRDVVAAGAHVGRSPATYGHHPRPGAVVLFVAFDQQSRRLPAQRPGRRRRHGAGIDGIEVASRRQHVGPPAGRRAGRPGLDERTRKAGQEPLDL